MSDEYKISLDQAEAVLPIKPHTFRQAGPMLIGADWTREECVEQFRKAGVSISGSEAQAMKHGLVSFDEQGPIFFETIRNTEDLVR